MKVKKINRKTAESIVLNRMPFGCFYLEENGKYTGIENSTGDAQIEHFATKSGCLRWLKK